MSYIFGPVPSRRLGRSLGVDLVPKKVCTLDCVYCQVGRTTNKTLTRSEYLPANEIMKELKEYFERGKGPKPDVITFSGSGEPTLNSRIGDLIGRIKRAFPDIPVAVLTNGTLLWDAQLRREIKNADIVIPSLDAATEETFRKVNRPHPDLSLERIIEGLFAFRKIYKGQLWLEVLMVRGLNDSASELKAIKKVLDELKPDKVQLNTVVRPPQEAWAKPIDRNEANMICALFGPNCEPIAGFERKDFFPREINLKQAIVELTKRRSVTIDDISEALGINTEQVRDTIKELCDEKAIKKVSFHGKTFYQYRGG